MEIHFLLQQGLSGKRNYRPVNTITQPRRFRSGHPERVFTTFYNCRLLRWRVDDEFHDVFADGKAVSLI